MQAYIDALLNNRRSQSNFRSEICHWRAHYTTKEFVTTLIQYDFIRNYWDKKWYFEAFYLLATLDYLSDLYSAPQLKLYDDIRKFQLDQYVYPVSIIALQLLYPDKKIYENAQEECKNDHYGKYFYKYNIIEKEDSV